jgi:threonylcarbamoyladenosine tRNA methylthiotransferase MtaB
MNRHYDREHYLQNVEKMRAEMPDISLTTDIIVGFPGESDEDFEATLDILRRVRYDMIYSFIYSPRKGTPAADMENQIDPQMKQMRSDKLIALNKQNFTNFAKKFEGQEFNVLFEQNIGENKYEGLTPNYIRVIVESEEDIQGKILKTKINDVKDEYVEGILV